MLENIIRGIIGIILLLACGYLLSSHKSKIDWKLITGGLVLQFLLALAILELDFVYKFFNIIADSFVKLLSYADEGAAFVFGKWPDSSYINTTPDGNNLFQIGYMFAFKVLPTVVFFSAFSAMLYYLGILQKIIYVIAFGLSKFMRLTGAESLASAANVFVGQTEAPLIIKPYLEKMTRSEIATVMVGGFATIAGGVFALFVSLIGPEYAIHFLTASIISAPAAIMVAKLIEPEVVEDIDRSVQVPKEKIGSNLLDAISIGTADGVKLAVNVGAMLLVIIALVAFLNGVLDLCGSISFANANSINELIENSSQGAYSTLSLEYLLGKLFAPLAYIIGVPWEESTAVGQLLGKKTAINEVVAYVDLQKMIKSGELSQKSIMIATYALCGFANFASIGIQIGGISAIAPNQRKNLTELGFKAMIGGTIATLLTGAIAGMILG